MIRDSNSQSVIYDLVISTDLLRELYLLIYNCWSNIMFFFFSLSAI